jgi:hypothetical protein
MSPSLIAAGDDTAIGDAGIEYASGEDRGLNKGQR